MDYMNFYAGMAMYQRQMQIASLKQMYDAKLAVEETEREIAEIKQKMQPPKIKKTQDTGRVAREQKRLQDMEETHMQRIIQSQGHAVVIYVLCTILVIAASLAIYLIFFHPSTFPDEASSTYAWYNLAIIPALEIFISLILYYCFMPVVPLKKKKKEAPKK